MHRNINWQAGDPRKQVNVSTELCAQAVLMLFQGREPHQLANHKEDTPLQHTDNHNVKGIWNDGSVVKS
jgi:hypothetical protein